MASSLATKLRPSSGLRVIEVSRLEPGRAALHALFHESATPLVAKGERITYEHVQALEAANIGEVYECKTEDDVLALAAATPKRVTPLTSVPIGAPSPFNIYDLNNQFLLRKGGVLTASQYDRLLQSSVENVCINDEFTLKTLSKYGTALLKSQAERLEKKVAKESELRVATGDSALPKLFQQQAWTNRKSEIVATQHSRHEAQVGHTSELLGSLWQEKAVDNSSVVKVVENLYDGLTGDINLRLHFTNIKDQPTGDFQRHSVNVTTLALAVGLALGYPEKKLKELALAALLHEVGMFSVPANIRDKRGALTPEETAQLQNHPVAAFRYLEKIRGISDRVLIAIYQEHEAPNRSGYPNQRPGHLMHDFAKILAICDAYDAMTSPRAHRSALLPYHAMEQLVRGASAQRYDFRILKGFLQAVGLFPIGSWVRLSNNRFAKVVANNCSPYDRPTVSVLYDETEQPLALPEVINLAEHPDLKIISVAESERFAGAQMLGF